MLGGEQVRSIGLAIIAFGVGAFFLILSNYLGILTYQTCWDGGVLASCAGSATIRKEVGFFAAVNWSFGLVILFPLFVYCVSESFIQAGWAIDELIEHRMIVTSDWQPATKEQISSIIKRHIVMVVGIIVAVAIVGGFFIITDFYTVVGAYYADPELVRQINLRDPQLEADWSIAWPICRAFEGAGCPDGDFKYNAALVFAIIAYFYLTWFGALLAVAFMLSILVFAASFLSEAFRAKRLLLVPDVTSDDPRRGFERFEAFFTVAIAGCFTLFALGYLVTLQNVYLRTDQPNVAQMLLPFLTKGGGFSFDLVIEGIRDSLTGQLGVINPNIVAVTMLGLLFLILMIGAVAYTLGNIAQRGQREMEEAIASGKPDVTGQIDQHLAAIGSSRPAAATALADFAYWPVRWVNINKLVGWLVAATISLLVVTLGAYIMAFGLWRVLKATFEAKK